MCMALWKFITWQGKSVIKNPNNITNKLSYYLYFILSSSLNMRKDGYTKNSFGEKLRILTKPSPPQYEGNRRQGADFLKCCSQSRSSPSKNSEKTQENENFGTIKIPKEVPPDKRSNGWRPRNKIRYPQGDRMGWTRHLAWALLKNFSCQRWGLL